MEPRHLLLHFGEY
jgi:hypothetical protein